ncbi:MAG: hypothetical protein U1C33_06040, partial [Candidatus Cloacimonadaceae bacterium]|nr:hypothetical protein [Candidatus Cloacimonadaceae bacterium]
GIEPFNVADVVSTYVLAWSNRYFLVWHGKYNGKYGIYSSLRTSAGMPEGNPRTTIIERTYGAGTILALQKRSNDALVIWRDTRNYYGPSSQEEIYYQIVNSNGDVELATDGAALITFPPMTPYRMKTTYLANGTTLVLFHYTFGNTAYLIGQAISPSGEILWGDSGKVLQSIPNIASFSKLMVHTEENDVFLAWAMNAPGGRTRNYLQKIVDGEIQWGNSGRIMTAHAIDTLISEIPASISDRFIVLETIDNSIFRKTLRVYHIEPDGQVTPGWDTNGVMLNSFDYGYDLNWSYVIASTPDKLLCAYQYDSGTDRRYRFYILDSMGNFPVNNQLLIHNNSVQEMMSIDSSNGFAYAVNLVVENVGYCLAYGKVDTAGNQSWDDDVAVATPPILTSTTPIQSIYGFANGGYALPWRTLMELYIHYVSPAGELIPLSDDNPIATNVTYRQPLYSMVNDELYLAWEDFSRTNTASNSDIRMQKLRNPTSVFTNDPVI